MTPPDTSETFLKQKHMYTYSYTYTYLSFQGAFQGVLASRVGAFQEGGRLDPSWGACQEGACQVEEDCSVPALELMGGGGGGNGREKKGDEGDRQRSEGLLHTHVHLGPKCV